MTKHEYIIRKDIKEIYHNSEVISNEFIRELDQSEVDNLILNENIQICINYEEDYLEWVDKAENLKLFNSKIGHHINTKNECHTYDNFKNRYFYYAELWKMKSGEELLVLQLKKKSDYYINRDTDTIYHNSKVISNEFIRELEQAEVDNLILNENIQICINYDEDYLEWVDKAENLKLFNSEIRNHINTESEYRGLDEFEHGYFLLAGLWKIKSGEKLLVLWYHH